MTLCLALLLALSDSSARTLMFAAEPAYPPNTLSGGTSVFAVRFAAGSVTEISLLSGQEPFSTLGRAALSQWKFDPEASGKTIVVICYRRPQLLAVDSGVYELGLRETEPGLPSPKVVVEPEYPPNAIAQGSVVLHMEVARDGSVGKCEVIKDLGALTETSVRAVQKWRFSPALDRRGDGVASEAYAVLVFRMPVLGPSESAPR